MAKSISIKLKIIDDFTKKFEQMATSGDKAVKSFSSLGDKADSAFSNVSSKAEKISSSMDTAEKASKKYSESGEKAAEALDKQASSADKAGKEIDGFSKEVEEADKETKEFGVSLSDLVKADLIASGIKTLAGAIFDFGKSAATAAIDVGSSFEEQMSKVKAISGATEEEFVALSNKAEEMGATTKFTATQAGQGLEYMAMAGWDASASIEALPAVLNLAAAAGEDLGKTSDIVTDAMTAFNMKADEANRFTDVLAATATSANTNVSMMGETFKYVAPVAGAMGYSIEDTSIQIGLMANAGIKATMAGTALRSIITRISTDAGASSTQLGALGTLTEELGVEFYNLDGSARALNDVISESREVWAGLSEQQQVNYAKAIAGQEAISAWMALMNASEADVKKVTAAIEECDGAAENMANTMQDNLKGKITIMGSALEGLGITVYKKFEEPMKSAVEAGTKGIDKINQSIKGGALGDSVDHLADSFENLTDSLIEGAEDALPKFIDGTAWVIDHGGEIIAIVEGTAAAYVTYKVAVEAVRISQEGLNATILANPLALGIAAVAGLTAVMIKLEAETGGVASAMSDTTRENLKYIESIENMNGAIEASASSREKERTNLIGQSEVAKDLVKEIDGLTAKYDAHGNAISRSAEQQADLAEKVSMLNSIYPDLGVAIDEHTGKLNMDTKAIEENIDAQLKSQQYALASEHINTIMKDKFDAQMELYDLNKKYEEQIAEVTAAEERLAEAKANQTEVFETNGQSIDGASYALINAKDAEAALKEQIDATNSSIESLDSEYEYCKQLMDDSAPIDGAAESMDGFADAAGDGQQATSALSGEIEDLIEDYAELRNEMLKAAQGSHSMFEEMKNDSTITFADMEKAFESQAKYINDYVENLKKAQGFGLDSGFLAALSDNSKESMDTLGRIVEEYERIEQKSGDAKKKIEEVNQAYRDVREAEARSAETSSNINFESQYGTQALNEVKDVLGITAENSQKVADNAKSMTESIASSGEAATSASESITAACESMDSTKDASVTVQKACTSVTESLDSISDSVPVVEDSMKSTTEALATIEKTPKSFSTAMTEINSTVSDGLDTMVSKITEATERMSMEDEAAEAAKKTIEAYVEELIAGGDKAISEAERIGSSIASALSTSMSFGSLGKFSLPGHADGTTYGENVYVAGEHGPELIIGRKGSEVFPASETAKILSAVYGLGTSDQHIEMPSEDIKTILHETKETTENRNNTETKNIQLTLSGKGSLDIGQSVSRKDLAAYITEEVEGAILNILRQEMSEEGSRTYEF